uniref:hypothetical protein n=1 Tax=Megasphaera sp. TaxID=2023260 RepID=UPI004028BCCC
MEKSIRQCRIFTDFDAALLRIILSQVEIVAEGEREVCASIADEQVVIAAGEVYRAARFDVGLARFFTVSRQVPAFASRFDSFTSFACNFLQLYLRSCPAT